MTARSQGSVVGVRLFFYRRGGRGASRLQGDEPADEGGQVGQVFEAGRLHERDLDDRPTVRASPESSAGFGDDLEGGEDRLHRPAFHEPREPRLLPRGRGQKRRFRADGENHDVSEEFDQAVEQVGRLDSFVRRAVDLGERGGRVVIGKGVDQVEHSLVAGGAESLVDGLDGQSFSTGREELFQERLRVAHRTRGAASDDAEGVRLGQDPFTLTDRGEGFEHLFGADSGEVVALAAGKNGDRNLVRLGGREEELDVSGGFFQRLQEGVEGPRGEHVDFINVVDLES